MVGMTLLDLARDSGLSLRLAGDRLVIRGPRRAEAVARELLARKAEVVALLKPPEPDPYAHLKGPRRTPWRTWAWSDPTAPEIAAFGPGAPAIDAPGPPGAWDSLAGIDEESPAGVATALVAFKARAAAIRAATGVPLPVAEERAYQEMIAYLDARVAPQGTVMRG
jgi:hypothetical protein